MMKYPQQTFDKLRSHFAYELEQAEDEVKKAEENLRHVQMLRNQAWFRLNDFDSFVRDAKDPKVSIYIPETPRIRER